MPILLFSLMLTFFQSPLSIKTVSYWNDEYFIPESYDELGLDVEKGHDINSEVYCNVGYGILRANNSEIIKPTISLNSLEIGIDINNNTDKSYFLDKVVLIPESKISPVDTEGIAGKYQNLTPASGYMGSVNLIVTDFSSETIFNTKGEDFAVYKSTEIADSRIRIKIHTEKKMNLKGYKIFKFNLEMHLIALSTNPEKIVVKSDQTYVMAFE